MQTIAEINKIRGSSGGGARYKEMSFNILKSRQQSQSLFVLFSIENVFNKLRRHRWSFARVMNQSSDRKLNETICMPPFSPLLYRD